MTNATHLNNKCCPENYAFYMKKFHPILEIGSIAVYINE